MQLTVQKTAEEQPELVGATLTIHPRQRAGGMCKIGRSTGDDFRDGHGVSLPKDWGVSTWHGKVRSSMPQGGCKHAGRGCRTRPIG